MIRDAPHDPWRAALVSLISTAMFVVAASVAPSAGAQTPAPPSIAVGPSSPVSTGGTENIPVSLTFPPDVINDKVDVFLLFDDTGSFAGFVPDVSDIFSALVTDLETSLPAVEFGFGVGRFEDYGGPGDGSSSESIDGRPFTLNQPIVTAATAGGAAARDTLINDALQRTAPGFGGDSPETDIEALYQTATGAGFDGDGNGSTLDGGVAGATSTQVTPGMSGDVPAFSSNVAPTSGSVGGAGWRGGSLHLVILATDISSVSAFPAGSPIPSTISGTGGAIPTSAFATSSTTPGDDRFGYVADAKTEAANTVLGAVAPAGAAQVQDTIDALNSRGIRVIGMGPFAEPTSSTDASSDPSVLLSALARLTGAVDSSSTPLVFSTSVSPADLTAAIADAIEISATTPVDVSLTTTAPPAGLTVSPTPSTVNDVAPGGIAPFSVALTGDGSAITGNFAIRFVDAGSGALLGSIPVTVECQATIIPTTTTYTGSASVQYSDAAALSGTLTETSGGAPVSGKTLDFTLGTQNASAGPTDASGNASTSLTVTQQPGSVTDVVTSFAGDATHGASGDTDPFSITKEDCTLAYTGDTLVNAANMTNLRAQFGEPDASPGDWSNKQVIFTVTDAALNSQTFNATTNAAGLASTQAALGPNVYGVNVSFAGDDFYEPCRTATDTLVTVQSAQAKITGGGFVAQSTGNTHFGFNVIPDVTGLKGQLQIRSKGGKQTFHSTTVLTLTTSANTGTWTGTGRWNGTDGYSFTVSVVDNGSSGGKRGDTISIVIKSPTNTTVFTTSGPQPLKGGNIKVH